MPIGRIKWFCEDKGYGWIERTGNSDVFLHYNSVHQSDLPKLIEGTSVEFDIDFVDGSPKANSVRIIESISQKIDR